MGKGPDHDRQNIRQHDSSYYQPQPGVQNYRQQYHNDKIIRQDSYKNNNDRYKWGSTGHDSYWNTHT